MGKEMSKNKKTNHRLKIITMFIIAAFLISIALVFLFPEFEASSSDVLPSGIDLGAPIPGSGATSNFFEYVTAIVAFCTNILGPVLAIAMIIYGGYRYIFSQGDSTALTEGKDIIFGAIIGYAILFLTKLIINIIGV